MALIDGTTPTTPPLPPSIIRTVVPIIVSQIVALAARKGLDLGEYNDLLSQLIGALVASLYYWGVRMLELHIRPKFGWLLGYASAPVYPIPTPPAPDVTTTTTTADHGGLDG